MTYLPLRWLPLVILLAAAGCAGGDAGDPLDVPPAMPGDSGAVDPTDPDGPPPPDAGRPRDGGSATAPDPEETPDAGSVPSARTVASCFEGAFESTPDLGPDYDVFSPTVGSHCLGTDHQEIEAVERVVFLGDSVTVGTPPTPSGDFYRARLADALADRFGLDAPNLLWKSASPTDGTALVRESGDFASCAKWGARADDLLRDNSQIEDCFPPETRDQRTLVVMTIGGNDISAITKAGLDGKPVDAIWEQTREFVQLLRDAVEWFYEDPTRFPNGVYVVFANMYEYTDGTGDTESCPGASLAGYGGEWEDPDALAEMVIWANEQFMSIAVENGIDMIFLLESFCGHGFRHDDPSAPCYRGPGTERWFDDTCIHPNPRGHEAIADMFMAVVDE